MSTLTADKAKEILKLAISDPDLVDTIDLLNAQKLGIEAIVKLQDIRARFPMLMPDPLPGEEPQ